MRIFKSKILHALAAAGAFFFMVGCAFSPGGRIASDKETPKLPQDGRKPTFLLIYLVHGDASYSYHDREGRRHRADEEAVNQALEVAKAGANAEVFIFHQRPARSSFFRPLQDGLLYHYRFGQKVREEAYFRYNGEDELKSEAALFQHYSSPAPVRFFTYFGHEIPADGGRGYSGSYPSRNFSLAELTQGLKGFAVFETDSAAGGGKPFSLIVLSTCKGGRPATVKALSSFTDFIVASPGDLHLSFFDTRAFVDIVKRPAPTFGRTESQALGTELARQSFARLKKATQTEITVAVLATEKGNRDDQVNRGHESLDTLEMVEFLHHPPRFGTSQYGATDAGDFPETQ